MDMFAPLGEIFSALVDKITTQSNTAQKAVSCMKAKILVRWFTFVWAAICELARTV